MDDQTAIQTVKSKITWVKTHEKLIALVLVLVTLVFLGNKWINYSATSADQKFVTIEQELKEQEARNADRAKQTAEAVSQYQDMVNTVTRQNAALAANVKQRDQDLKKKQEDVKNMPLESVNREWEHLLNAPQGVLSVQGSTTAVPEPQARQTVIMLEEAPVCKLNLSDTKKALDNSEKAVAQCTQVVHVMEVQVAEDANTLALEKKAHKAEVDKAVADGRKSKRGWFIAGFVAGIATRLGFKF